MANNNFVKKTWNNLSPDRKRWVAIGGILGACLLVGYVVSPGDKPSRGQGAPGRDTVSVGQILGGAKTDELGMTGFANDVDTLRSRMDDMEGQISGEQNNAAINALRAEINALKKQLEASGQEGGNGGSSNNVAPPPGTSLSPAMPGRTDIAGQAQQRTGITDPSVPTPFTPIVVRTIKPEEDKPSANDPLAAVTAANQSTSRKKPVEGHYVPATTLIHGEFVSGLDAPTGPQAGRDPIPVIVRLKDLAFMPNRYRVDLDACHLLASGYGDLASERAYLRAERMSCIRNDGQIIDIAVEMSAIGDDSKAGVRGTLISKQGRAVANAAMAGFAEGLSRAFSRSSFVGGSGGADVATQSFAGGAGSSLDRISEYYLDMANQMFPVIQVSATRTVDFVVIKGFRMTPIEQPEPEVVAKKRT